MFWPRRVSAKGVKQALTTCVLNDAFFLSTHFPWPCCSYTRTGHQEAPRGRPQPTARRQRRRPAHWHRGRASRRCTPLSAASGRSAVFPGARTELGEPRADDALVALGHGREQRREHVEQALLQRRGGRHRGRRRGRDPRPGDVRACVRARVGLRRGAGARVRPGRAPRQHWLHRRLA